MGYMQRTTLRLLGDMPNSGYVVIPTALIRDGKLTSDARMVGAYLLSLEDGWDVSQRSIAAGLGWPTNSKRVGNAMKLLIQSGWLRHNEYKHGDRIYKHEYVMHRARRVCAPAARAVGSTPYKRPSYAVKSTMPMKYQREADGLEGPSELVPVKQDPWG
ncbi:hypothetical protein SEA_HANNACONDA_76 [Mycobacterium phage Hannaconda]|nr:hypothetical protein SEA_HANNACONDA_76 [Mycobacterium phage Hannaconda]